MVYFQFKQLVSAKFSAPVPQLCLIFAGRILKDAETLDSYCKFFLKLLLDNDFFGSTLLVLGRYTTGFSIDLQLSKMASPFTWL